MSSEPIDTPEIIPPDKADALEALEIRQALEYETFLHIQSLAQTMDAQYKIPFLPIPIGLDAIIGFIPGIGDTITLGVAGYIVLRAQRLGIRKRHLAKMGFNIGIDWLIGLIPIIGDLFDIGWRGNLRNAEIVRIRLETRWAKQRYDLLNS
ncbi:DUF4112 domain-containing protein [Litorimonas sp. RW-G-Af-16]|uniref:DUF4112 domain-containing protein n=1 Tax=Litorimonas sp. RW-G-Af-16 TaxID=3241168 RepID=UPI003AAE80AD